VNYYRHTVTHSLQKNIVNAVPLFRITNDWIIYILAEII
jgi:hypothetical protein